MNATVSLPQESWQRIQATLLTAALRTDDPEDAEKLLKTAAEVAPAADSDLLDAVEMDVRESLGMELVA